jgi:hypothetical protein
MPVLVLVLVLVQSLYLSLCLCLYLCESGYIMHPTTNREMD